MVPRLIKRYWSGSLTIPMCQGLRWEPPWKALPSDKSLKRGEPKGILVNLFKEIQLFFRLPFYVQSLNREIRDRMLWDRGFTLWEHLERFPCNYDANNLISTRSIRATARFNLEVDERYRSTEDVLFQQPTRTLSANH